MRSMSSSTACLTKNKTKTDMKQKKTLIHVYPVEDSGHKHTLSLKCKCKPLIKEYEKAVSIDHHMVGTGPDSWTIDCINQPDK